MNTSIPAVSVGRSDTLRAALERLQQSGAGLLLLLDANGRLLRTVSDGDLRRMLLAGRALDDTLGVLPPQPPHVIRAPFDAQHALETMNDHQIDRLPVIDDDGRPVQLLRRQDLDTSILLSTPHLGDYEIEFVQEAFRTNWVAPLGPNVDAFERELADYVGCAHAAAVSSGTAALHLALRLLGIDRGDTVFCSSLTFVASANPILYQGATPVFIDSEPATWNMSPAALARALDEARRAKNLPKAVIVVNLYGQTADFDPIHELCRAVGVPVIEDAAESLGATYKGRKSGTLGLMSAFSFNGNKIITTSGGGMLVSDDGDLIRRARHLSTQAREPAPYYEHTEVGYNYRMSNVLAGIGRGQMRVLEQRVRARQDVYRRYVERTRGLPIEWMPEPPFGRCTHWLSAATLAAPLDVGLLIRDLQGERIEARRVWKPMHMQPLFADAPYYPHAVDRDVARQLFETGICLPSSSNLTDEQQGRIVEALQRRLKA